MKNTDIAWVHTGQVKDRRNKKCNEVMALYDKFPHIATGNNPEYAYYRVMAVFTGFVNAPTKLLSMLNQVTI